jgi:hypothetical protein
MVAPLYMLPPSEQLAIFFAESHNLLSSQSRDKIPRNHIEPASYLQEPMAYKVCT